MEPRRLFGARPRHPPDEPGQLAERLDQIARALLSARQELATLEERNRLALDLHDSVKQQAFATAMQVSTARALLGNPEAAERHLGEAEALANVARHSGATQVTLRLESTATYTTLSLYDNGRGFDLDSVRRGVGLTSMRERLEQQGGTLKTSPAPGQGTRVVARWPLPLEPT